MRLDAFAALTVATMVDSFFSSLPPVDHEVIREERTIGNDI